MGRVDDHHHRSKIDRDIARERQAERIKQQDWERAQASGAAEGPVPSKPEQPARETPESVSVLERGRQAGEVALERVDYAVNNTPIGDAFPPGTGPALAAARTAADLYANREMAALEAKEKAHDAARAIKDATDAGARTVSKGVNEVGQQIAEGMHSVGSSSYVDPFIEMQVREMNEREQRASTREQTRPQNPDR